MREGFGCFELTTETGPNMFGFVNIFIKLKGNKAFLFVKL